MSGAGWAVEFSGGAWEFTALEGIACQRPEVRAVGLPKGITCRTAQSFRAGLYVFRVTFINAKGAVVQPAADWDVALDIWGVQPPALPVTEEI